MNENIFKHKHHLVSRLLKPCEFLEDLMTLDFVCYFFFVTFSFVAESVITKAM